MLNGAAPIFAIFRRAGGANSSSRNLRFDEADNFFLKAERTNELISANLNSERANEMNIFSANLKLNEDDSFPLRTERTNGINGSLQDLRLGGAGGPLEFLMLGGVNRSPMNSNSAVNSKLKNRANNFFDDSKTNNKMRFFKLKAELTERLNKSTSSIFFKNTDGGLRKCLTTKILT